MQTYLSKLWGTHKVNVKQGTFKPFLILIMKTLCISWILPPINILLNHGHDTSSIMLSKYR